MEHGTTLSQWLARDAANLLTSGDPARLELIYSLILLLIYFVLAALGAAVAEVFAPNRGPGSSVGFWESFFPNWDEVHHFRINFIAKVLGGAAIALILVAPTSERQALAAGLGWAGALTAFLSQKAGSQKTGVARASEPLTGGAGND